MPQIPKAWPEIVFKRSYRDFVVKHTILDLPSRKPVKTSTTQTVSYYPKFKYGSCALL